VKKSEFHNHHMSLLLYTHMVIKPINTAQTGMFFSSTKIYLHSEKQSSIIA